MVICRNPFYGSLKSDTLFHFITLGDIGLGFKGKALQYRIMESRCHAAALNALVVRPVVVFDSQLACLVGLCWALVWICWGCHGMRWLFGLCAGLAFGCVGLCCGPS